MERSVLLRGINLPFVVAFHRGTLLRFKELSQQQLHFRSTSQIPQENTILTYNSDGNDYNCNSSHCSCNV
eukprot:4870573-Amphidinium_carterae.1